MSNPDHTPNRYIAETNVASGQLKQTIGSLVDQTLGTNLRAAGEAQEQGGHAEIKAADAIDYNVGLKDRVAGGIQNFIGQITGDAQQEASGKAQQVKGEQLQAATAPPELRK